MKYGKTTLKVEYILHRIELCLAFFIPIKLHVK